MRVLGCCSDWLGLKSNFCLVIYVSKVIFTVSEQEKESAYEAKHPFYLFYGYCCILYHVRKDFIGGFILVVRETVG